MWRLPGRVIRRFPRRMAIPVLTRRSRGRSDQSDVRSVEVPAPFHLDVYWLVLGDNEGPAASLFLENEELMRVDCLRSDPHVHYCVAEARYLGAQEPRVYFPSGDMDAQIRRAVFEVATNVPYALGLDRRRRVRTITPDPDAFEEASQRVGEHMRDLVASRPHQPAGS